MLFNAGQRPLLQNSKNAGAARFLYQRPASLLLRKIRLQQKEATGTIIFFDGLP